MKKLLIAAALVLSVGCSNKDENEARTSFYLSQPRDPALVGWWVQASEPADGEMSIHYTVFNTDGTMYWASRRLSDGKLFKNPTWYWYAKDGVYHIFERRDSWAKASTEYDVVYEVRGDEMWIDNPGVGWMASQKRTEPQQ